MLKISHFIASLMQIEFTVYVMKHLSNIAVTNSYNSLLVIQIFFAFYWYVRTYKERIYSFVRLILCVALTSRYRTQFFCLTLFPRIRFYSSMHPETTKLVMVFRNSLSATNGAIFLPLSLESLSTNLVLSTVSISLSKFPYSLILAKEV